MSFLDTPVRTDSMPRCTATLRSKPVCHGSGTGRCRAHLAALLLLASFSVASPTASICDDIVSCRACNAGAGCGWCATDAGEGICVAGNATAPLQQRTCAASTSQYLGGSADFCSAAFCEDTSADLDASCDACVATRSCGYCRRAPPFQGSFCAPSGFEMASSACLWPSEWVSFGGACAARVPAHPSIIGAPLGRIAGPLFATAVLIAALALLASVRASGSGSVAVGIAAICGRVSGDGSLSFTRLMSTPREHGRLPPAAAALPEVVTDGQSQTDPAYLHSSPHAVSPAAQLCSDEPHNSQDVRSVCTSSSLPLRRQRPDAQSEEEPR